MVRSFVSDTDGNFVFGESVSKKVSEWFENGISLVSAPNRTVYYKDGELDVSGAKIEDIVSGDIIDVESSMISGADFSTVGEKTVTVNYLGMELSLIHILHNITIIIQLIFVCVNRVFL